MGRNLPRFAQYTQTFHLLFPPEVDTSAINDPAVSAHPCFLGHFSPPRHSTILGLFCLSSPLIHLHLQTSSLASAHNICNLLAINPLFMLCQDSRTIHSELHDGHLVLDGVFIL